MYTTDDLLSSIRTRASCPAADARFTDAKLLALANEEVDSTIVPLLMRVREEYLGTQQDETITTPNQVFRMPRRAIGAKLRAACLVDTASHEIAIPQLDLNDLEQQAWAGFYIQGNNVCLFRPSTNTGDWPTNTFRMKYYLKPSRLVATSAVATITGISGSTLTISTPPATFTGRTSFDLVQGAAPFEILTCDAACAAQSGSTVVLSVAPSSLLAVGDYVTIPGESCVPQLPLELHPVLAQAVAVKVLESLGDREGMAAAEAKLKAAGESAESVLKNRVEGNPRKFVNRQNLFTRRWTWGAWR